MAGSQLPESPGPTAVEFRREVDESRERRAVLLTMGIAREHWAALSPLVPRREREKICAREVGNFVFEYDCIGGSQPLKEKRFDGAFDVAA